MSAFSHCRLPPGEVQSNARALSSLDVAALRMVVLDPSPENALRAALLKQRHAWIVEEYHDGRREVRRCDHDTNSQAWTKIDPKSSRRDRSLALPTISANNFARSSIDILILAFSINLVHVEQPSTARFSRFFSRQVNRAALLSLQSQFAHLSESAWRPHRSSP